MFTIDIEANETIENLREKIGEKIPYNPPDLRLIYKGKQLENGRTLADYNIVKEETIHVVYRR